MPWRKVITISPAMVPETPYGDVIASAFADAVKSTNAASVEVDRFTPNSASVMAPSAAIAKSNADAVLIAQGGGVLRAIAPSLAFNGLDPAKVKLLGTGLWDDAAIAREQTLTGGWFAAPEPDADNAFNDKYKSVYGAQPPQLATLAYDAISLVALLSTGAPYHRFTSAALMDPNGFSGVSGIFRFNADGTSERGLAVLEVQPDGFHVVSPSPKTFQAQLLVQKLPDYRVQDQAAFRCGGDDIAVETDEVLFQKRRELGGGWTRSPACFIAGQDRGPRASADSSSDVRGRHRRRKYA